jgi:hypothetical protein
MPHVSVRRAEPNDYEAMHRTMSGPKTVTGRGAAGGVVLACGLRGRERAANLGLEPPQPSAHDGGEAYLRGGRTGGKSVYGVCQALERASTPSPKGNWVWVKLTVKGILCDDAYRTLDCERVQASVARWRRAV